MKNAKLPNVPTATLQQLRFKSPGDRERALRITAAILGDLWEAAGRDRRGRGPLGDLTGYPRAEEGGRTPYG